jgi:predicted ArsR family transcriptional regulator
MSDQSKPGRNPRVTDGEILDVLRRTDDPVLSTAEVADGLPIKRRATLTRLQRLAESGDVSAKQTGGRTTVWWLAGGGSAADRPEGEQPDDRTVIEERAPEDILDELDTFLDEHDAPDVSVPSADAVRDDYHAHRHRENLERLAESARE